MPAKGQGAHHQGTYNSVMEKIRNEQNTRHINRKLKEEYSRSSLLSLEDRSESLARLEISTKVEQPETVKH
jgi:hypothetical protein